MEKGCDKRKQNKCAEPKESRCCTKETKKLYVGRNPEDRLRREIRMLLTSSTATRRITAAPPRGGFDNRRKTKQNPAIESHAKSETRQSQIGSTRRSTHPRFYLLFIEKLERCFTVCFFLPALIYNVGPTCCSPTPPSPFDATYAFGCVA